MTEERTAVLVVDDIEAKRYLLGSWLRRAGYSVLEAGTGQEALDRARDADLILLDIRLPDISGREVCERIKADPRTAATPVVQVSAAAVTVADRVHGLNRGADVYLTDPIEEEELLATVLAVLRYYRARQQAEQTVSRLTALTRSTLAINAASTFDQLARAAVQGAVQIFGAPAVHIQVLPDGQLCRLFASPGHPVPVQKGGDSALAETVARVALQPDDHNAAVNLSPERWQQLWPDTSLRSDVCLAAARTKSDQPVLIAVDRAAVLGDEELQILRQFVQAVALAVDALRAYADQHLVALTLQRSFLPAVLPEVPGLAMAARYTPASEQAEVGGDFYEALIVGDEVLLAIGDVQGHSLHAATVMGELRHALRAFAEEGHSPLEISGLLGSVMRRYHPGILATICLARIDPASGELQIVNCGHIPALLIDGSAASYCGQGGLLLGMPMHDPYSEAAVVPPGGTLLLITDGLVEDRRVLLDESLERLRAAAEARRDADVDTLANHLLSEFGPREDDVALIVVRRA
jgi:serine phosphatase RsbU (regulator of sigma subunit)/FixJ family two-component response regulator